MENAKFFNKNLKLQLNSNYVFQILGPTKHRLSGSRIRIPSPAPKIKYHSKIRYRLQ